MIKKLKKIKIKDFMGFIILLFAFPISLIVRIKNRNNKIWLICELKDTARDNGFHFFKYIRINHPSMNCWYAINKKSLDYNNVKDYGNIIEFGSFKHWIYYLASEYNLSSHKEGNPNHLVFTVIHRYLRLLNNRVFLQHGITKDDAPMFYYKNSYFKYFICGAKKEYDYIQEKFGYPSKNVVYTGFPRFDNLHNCKVNKNKILLIPTWRRWFENDNNILNFLNSNYYKKWNSFINNVDLKKFLEENGIQLIFYPHISMKKYISSFKTTSKNIRIMDINKVNVQDLLKECALMITDYSSVYMDFAYMKKPIVYYHFDYEEYRKDHFKEGYFNYKKDGFGVIVNNEKELLKEIKYCYDNGFNVRKVYLERMDAFFKKYDTNNCERIFNLLLDKE